LLHSPHVTSPLTRGWVCYLQLLLSLASAVILRSESRRTRDHILLSQIRDSPNLEGEVPIFISPRNRVAQLYHPGTGFHFHCLLQLTGLRWRYSTPPPLPLQLLSELSLYNYGTDSIENTVSNIASNCCSSCCPAMGWTLLRVYPPISHKTQ
jgi:hypothetical protein